jgi:hypothetical protein
MLTLLTKKEKKYQKKKETTTANFSLTYVLTDGSSLMENGGSRVKPMLYVLLFAGFRKRTKAGQINTQI